MSLAGFSLKEREKERAKIRLNQYSSSKERQRENMKVNSAKLIMMIQLEANECQQYHKRVSHK